MADIFIPGPIYKAPPIVVNKGETVRNDAQNDGSFVQSITLHQDQSAGPSVGQFSDMAASSAKSSGSGVRTDH